MRWLPCRPIKVVWWWEAVWNWGLRTECTVYHFHLYRTCTCVLVTESSNLWCHVFHGETTTVMYLWRHCMCYVMSSEQNREYRLAFGQTECLTERQGEAENAVERRLSRHRWRCRWWRHRSLRRRRAYVQCCLNEIKYWKCKSITSIQVPNTPKD